jgi:uncharacterized membrane protein
MSFYLNVKNSQEKTKALADEAEALESEDIEQEISDKVEVEQPDEELYDQWVHEVIEEEAAHELSEEEA